jgi:hypothetical protein
VTPALSALHVNGTVLAVTAEAGGLPRMPRAEGSVLRRWNLGLVKLADAPCGMRALHSLTIWLGWLNGSRNLAIAEFISSMWAGPDQRLV